MTAIIRRAVAPIDPPAVLAEHGSGRETRHDGRPGNHVTAPRPDANPVALDDRAGRRIVRRDLHDRVGDQPAQRVNIAVLAVAVGDALGTAEAQRVIRVDRQKIVDVETG